MYLAIANRILGNGHPFAEDVVSECMIKANSLIEKGNEITPQYFSAMVLNASLDYIKKRDNRLTCRIPDNYEVVDDSENYVNFEFSICDVEEYLRQYEVQNIHNKFRADIFRLHFIDGDSLLCLQNKTTIDRKYLAVHKKIIADRIYKREVMKRMLSMKKPSRTDEKYRTSNGNFNQSEYVSDLEQYSYVLEEKLMDAIPNRKHTKKKAKTEFKNINEEYPEYFKI